MVSWAFCDFGPNFEVLDSTGEEPKEFFVWKITKVRKQHNFDDKNKTNFIVILYKTVFSLNFSSGGKGSFTAGMAKNVYHRGARFRGQAGRQWSARHGPTLAGKFRT